MANGFIVVDGPHIDAVYALDLKDGEEVRLRDEDDQVAVYCASVRDRDYRDLSYKLFFIGYEAPLA